MQTNDNSNNVSMEPSKTVIAETKERRSYRKPSKPASGSKRRNRDKKADGYYVSTRSIRADDGDRGRSGAIVETEEVRSKYKTGNPRDRRNAEWQKGYEIRRAESQKKKAETERAAREKVFNRELDKQLKAIHTKIGYGGEFTEEDKKLVEDADKRGRPRAKEILGMIAGREAEKAA